MKIKLNVRQKISFSVLSVALILFAITIGYFALSTQKAARKNLTELTISYTDQYAMVIENWLSNDLAVSRTISKAFLEHKQLPFEQWRELIMGMYKQIMIVNPHFDAIWDSWEFSHLNPDWDKPYGRWLHIYYRKNGKLLSKYEKRSVDGDPAVYQMLKTKTSETVVEPYLSALQTGGLMTSLTSPMFIQGKFVGIIGIDLFLGRFQDLIKDIKPYEECASFLVSNEGTIVAHSDTSIFSKRFQDAYPELDSTMQVMTRIKRAEKFSFIFSNTNGERCFYSFSPINAGKTNQPWSLAMVVPERVMLAEANRSYNVGLLVGIIGMIILIVTIVLLANTITKPIKKITSLLESLSIGKINHHMKVSINTGDEIEQMGNALSKSIDGLLLKTDFAKDIGEGNLNTELKLLSDSDTLGESLLDMQASLIKAEHEDEIRQIDNQKRRWINEGHAEFADILRQDSDNLERLNQKIIKKLVQYLDANLGGIYVKNDNNAPVTFDLSASYAYDRNRFLDSSFEWGEGLVGACAAEAETIYLTEIPQDYVQITSGIGGVNPNNLVVVPLLVEEEVLGVIELAAIKIFEKHEIEFLEKQGESIASALRNVQINHKTTQLLQKSQEQAEALASQEEEMRQNLEELQATQEEASRKNFEMQAILEVLNASSFFMEYDSFGKIISVNDKYLELLNVKRNEILGTHHSDNLELTDIQRSQYEKFWDDLRNGKTQKQTTKTSVGGKEFSFLETYTPIRNSSGEVYKVIKIASEIIRTENN
ncbi:MAG: GAF domain-containing protein [Bacteroidales bacterium]|nr:GAF domain-containing protein [Bacteroidales bacterium]MDD4671317.1 GAF domain-containing protein [Bacteroidales bacterium]MDY0348394.1 GAF domain-containing protein [Tenuifilaceae bacterium]